MRNRGLIGVSLSVALTGFALAQQPKPPPLTPDADRFVRAYETRISRLQAEEEAKPPPADVAEALARRVAIDQAARRFEWEMAPNNLPIEEQRLAMQYIGRTMIKVDDDNTAWLKSVLPPDGWFRISRDGPTVANYAFLIVQHSQDQQFKRDVLARMEPLLKEGDVSPQSYGLLFDRVQVFAGKKQVYGTQATCKDGKLGIDAMDEPDKVQERRDAIGFTRPRFDDYRKMFDGRPC